MNPLDPLLTALYIALTTPPMTWEEVDVPVGQPQLEGNTDKPYVLLTQPTDGDAGGGANCAAYSCTVTIDVVTQFTGYVTSLPVEGIVSQIHERLRRKRLLLPAPWDCGPGVAAGSLQIEELDGEHQALRRVLRYRWEINYHS